MASFEDFLLKPFKNLFSLFSVMTTDMHTFFIKQVESQSSYLACEKCFYLLSGMLQSLLELLFRKPDVGQHTAQLLRSREVHCT